MSLSFRYFRATLGLQGCYKSQHVPTYSVKVANLFINGFSVTLNFCTTPVSSYHHEKKDQNMLSFIDSFHLHTRGTVLQCTLGSSYKLESRLSDSVVATGVSFRKRCANWTLSLVVESRLSCTILLKKRNKKIRTDNGKVVK